MIYRNGKTKKIFAKEGSKDTGDFDAKEQNRERREKGGRGEELFCTFLPFLLGFSLLFSTLSFAEERIYGISDYGPVSVNGNGVGRGKDPSYQYIEDLLYGSSGANSSSPGSGASSGAASSSGTVSSPQGNPAPSGTAVSGETTSPVKSGGNLQNLAKLSPGASTKTLSSEITANYAVVFDLDKGSILAEKNSSQTMNPASMTKVMSLLLFAENIPNQDKKLTITQDIIRFVQQRGASNCGFIAGEEVAVKDLLYGVILPSGADAVLALCKEVSGSETKFAELMNKRAKEMGLSSQCYFQNATGLYHGTHHMTVKDMGQIMATAMQNPTARGVLMTENYQMSPTNKHANGLKFTNLFLQRIKTQDLGGARVEMAKTGFVSQSKFCVVSSGKGKNGRNLLIVTGGSSGTWQAVRDQAALYKLFSS